MSHSRWHISSTGDIVANGLEVFFFNNYVTNIVKSTFVINEIYTASMMVA